MIYHHYPSPEAVARAVAETAFVQPSQAGWVHIALSGGSTPRLLFELLAEEPLCSAVDWSRIHLYWVDERCVPPTDPDSNYGMTEATLLRHVPISQDQVHRIAGEKLPEREAKDYCWLVGSELPFDGAFPVFDIVLLGLGEDGHTSSIFPHQMELLTEEAPYAVGISPKGQPRIAMTGPTILAAKRILFHTTGEKKAPILQHIVEQAPEADAYPAAYIFRQRADVELYTDVALPIKP